MLLQKFLIIIENFLDLDDLKRLTQKIKIITIIYYLCWT